MGSRTISGFASAVSARTHLPSGENAHRQAVAETHRGRPVGASDVDAASRAGAFAVFGKEDLGAVSGKVRKRRAVEPAEVTRRCSVAGHPDDAAARRRPLQEQPAVGGDVVKNEATGGRPDDPFASGSRDGPQRVIGLVPPPDEQQLAGPSRPREALNKFQVFRERSLPSLPVGDPDRFPVDERDLFAAAGKRDRPMVQEEGLVEGLADRETRGRSSRESARDITARLSPSGAHAAANTSSWSSRAAPPPSGTRASVPIEAGDWKLPRPIRTASSPRGDTDRTLAWSSPSGRDSTESVRTEKSSDGLPSHAAP